MIVNLDTLEYINPVRFGQVPTLAGMVRQAPKHRCLPILKKAAKDNDYLVDVAGGLFAMLCHPKRRGGGDLSANAEELSVAPAHRILALKNQPASMRPARTSKDGGAPAGSSARAKSPARIGRQPRT